jgi:hypothetical protein
MEHQDLHRWITVECSLNLSDSDIRDKIVKPLKDLLWIATKDALLEYVINDPFDFHKKLPDIPQHIKSKICCKLTDCISSERLTVNDVKSILSKKFPDITIDGRNKRYIDNFYKEAIDGIRLQAIKSGQYLIDYEIINNYLDAQLYANFIQELQAIVIPINFLKHIEVMNRVDADMINSITPDNHHLEIGCQLLPSSSSSSSSSSSTNHHHNQGNLNNSCNHEEKTKKRRMVIYEVDNSVLVQSYLDEEDIIDSSALTVKKERRLSLLPHHSQHSSAAADIQAVVHHDSHVTQDIHHQHESQNIVHNNSEYDHVVDNDYDDHCDDDHCDDYDDHCDVNDDHCDDDDDDDDDNHCDDDDDDHSDDYDDDDHCDDDCFDGHSDDHRDECYENDDHGSFDPNRFQSFIAITPVEQQQQLLQTADVANHTSQKRITRHNSIVNECSKVSINANNDDNYHPHFVQHHIVSPPPNNNNNISTMQRGLRSSVNKNRSKAVTVDKAMRNLRKSKNINGQIINLKDKHPKSVMNKKNSTKVTIVHKDDNDDNNNVDDQVNNDELFTVALHRLTTVVRNQNKVLTSLKFFTRALNKHSMLTTTLIRFEKEVIPVISTILSNHKTLSKVSLMMKCD